VTLAGPGGSGKTRLAVESAAELTPEYPSGLFWIGSAALADPTLVLHTAPRALGAQDALPSHLADRQLLLVFDTFARVVSAATDVASLLRACPHLAILVTSRELLRIEGEADYMVPPLSKPEAVELFCTRSHLETDDTIAALCGRLDNMPLAVE